MPGVRDVDAAPTTEDGGRNRPAEVGTILATGVVAALLSFTTVLGWLYAGFFVALAIACSVGAIVAGHVGRRRRYRTARVQALLCVVVGWAGLLVTGAGILVSLGLLAGLAILSR